MMPSDTDPEEILPSWESDLPVAPVPDSGVPVAAAPAAICCPVCQATNSLGRSFCDDCGYHFSPADLVLKSATIPDAILLATPVAAQPSVLLLNRFEVTALVNERCGVQRFQGLDRGDGSSPPQPVMILAQALPRIPEALPVVEEPVNDLPPLDTAVEDEILPTFDDPPVATPISEGQIVSSQPSWPSIGWEKSLLETFGQVLGALPAIIDYFIDNDVEYLVEEIPTGNSLWDAWEDEDSRGEVKYGFLMELARILQGLHQNQCMLEGIRPEMVVITEEGRLRIKDLTDLLPLPLVSGAPIRGSLYSAPELLSQPERVDARADLYSFGALLYSLHVGRELHEVADFDRPGTPKPFIPRFPDIHPGFGRLMTKTFRKEVDSRLPTDEAGRTDPTGFEELIQILSGLQRTADLVRLEIASWTTTGIVRTGNEDAFALIHATESRQDDLGEAALVILCDGMGGYEAGEVAAAMAINVIRTYLLQQPLFGHLAGRSLFPGDPASETGHPLGHAGPPLDVEEARQLLKNALREANRVVYTTSRAPGSKRRGMGCTAEVVYVDGRNVVVGHVGDSRTYHLHDGQLNQMTRDQTLVNRLVELGTLTAEQAEVHPRRNELQQAIGGQPDVIPGLYHGRMKAGDWVVVCSDGLSNHIDTRMLKEMLQTEAASAEMAARRLVNLTNIEGATDNATVVVVRAT